MADFDQDPSLPFCNVPVSPVIMAFSKGFHGFTVSHGPLLPRTQQMILGHYGARHVFVRMNFVLLGPALIFGVEDGDSALCANWRVWISAGLAASLVLLQENRAMLAEWDDVARQPLLPERADKLPHHGRYQPLPGTGAAAGAGALQPPPAASAGARDFGSGGSESSGSSSAVSTPRALRRISVDAGGVLGGGGSAGPSRFSSEGLEIEARPLEGDYVIGADGRRLVARHSPKARRGVARRTRRPPPWGGSTQQPKTLLNS